MNKEIQRCFSSEGELANYFNQFQPRQGQVEMADACFSCLRQGGQLIAEAGTGIGKTFAYGVAALLSGRKVVISTASKSLQDQLSKRDLPQLCMALGIPANIVLLKGRENYVCQQRYAQAEQQAVLQHNKGLQVVLQEVRRWSQQTKTAELAEVLGNRSNPAWDKVCARSEFCAVASCDADHCAYPALRADSENADIIVINHHLLGADLALRAAGLTPILPDRDALIIDEAHQLADVLEQALGQGASTLSWTHALRDLLQLMQAEITDMPATIQAIQELQIVLLDWQMTAKEQKGKMNAETWLQHDAQAESLHHFIDHWQKLASDLALAADRSPTIKAQVSLLVRLADATLNWSTVAKSHIAWAEASQQHWYFYITPLSVADEFAHAMQKQYASLILTSATLAVNDSFDYVQNKLGLWKADCHRWLSPYNYAQHALLYLPHNLPAPNSENYTVSLLRRIWPLIIANKGRAFLLFTSYKALQIASDTLKPHLPFPLLVQGDDDNHRLLTQFREKGNAVLLATASFWEGVDVSGSALSLVVIDKIPFSPPDDPVTQAKENLLAEKGLSAFVCESLPSATMSMIQGAGRLIRSETDTGVLVIGDPRIQTRGYGKQILASLPPMKVVYGNREALAFIEQQTASTEGT